MVLQGELVAALDNADGDSALEIFADAADELLTLEDLDPEYEPDADVFDGPDELMVMDDDDGLSLDEMDRQDTVVAKMEGPAAAEAALLTVKEEARRKTAEAAAAVDKPTPAQLRERWKLRAQEYQRNVDAASSKVIEASKKYDKTAEGAIPVGDVVNALEDLGVSLTSQEKERMPDEIETLPNDAFRVSVNALQVVAQRYKPDLEGSPKPTVAATMLGLLGDVLERAPKAVRRTMQTMELRRSTLRDLRTALASTETITRDQEEAGPAAAGETAAGDEDAFGPRAPVSKPSGAKDAASPPTRVMPLLRDQETLQAAAMQAELSKAEEAKLARAVAAQKAAEAAAAAAGAGEGVQELRAVEQPEAAAAAEREEDGAETGAQAPFKTALDLVLEQKRAEREAASSPQAESPRPSGAGRLFDGTPIGGFLESFSFRGPTDAKPRQSVPRVPLIQLQQAERDRRAKEQRDKAERASRSPGDAADLVEKLRQTDRPEEAAPGPLPGEPVSATPAAAAGGGQWRAATDPPTGQTYYWNTETREVTWDKPDECVEGEGPT